MAADVPAKIGRGLEFENIFYDGTGRFRAYIFREGREQGGAVLGAPDEKPIEPHRQNRRRRRDGWRHRRLRGRAGAGLFPAILSTVLPTDALSSLLSPFITEWTAGRRRLIRFE